MCFNGEMEAVRPCACGRLTWPLLRDALPGAHFSSQLQSMCLQGGDSNARRPPLCCCRCRAAFTLAAKLAPCVLFIDEVDSLLGRRNSSKEHEALR